VNCILEGDANTDFFIVWQMGGGGSVKLNFWTLGGVG
jgi:hypothetical protein